MKYYVYSPSGRTGSKRVLFFLRGFKTPHEYTIMSETETNINGVSTTTTKTDIKQKLNTSVDGTVVHSHSLVLPDNLDDWTIILTERKSKAEQIMSGQIAYRIPGGFSPVDPSITCEPFSLDKNTVTYLLTSIKNKYQKFYETVDSYVLINMEDSVEEIGKKITLRYPEEITEADTITKSNHHYKDIIINYKEVFEWCGEEYNG